MHSYIQYVCPAGKRHGVRFSDSSVQRFHGSSPPFDRRERQQVTIGRTGRHQCGLKQQVDASKPIENTANPKWICSHLCSRECSMETNKQANKSIPVVLRPQPINAVKITWCAAANQNEKNGGTSDNMRIVLNVCYKWDALCAEMNGWANPLFKGWKQ